MNATISATSVPTPSQEPFNTKTPGDIPRFVTYTSPVSVAPDGLPLNLVAKIVGFLEETGDVARVTRTNKLLYYMTLPQLYERVSLHSYAEIQYRNGRPEGFGGGSPFIMGLNGLVTKSHASLVKEFRLWGQWAELGVEDFAKGRIPDNSMMLNTLVGVAIQRMLKLRSFYWELDSKPLKTLYQNLGAHGTLTSLKIKFPNSRIPRPSVIIPPMANLRAFHVTDIDPLCYPDDISVLLLHSKKLIDLRLHFSPRMRKEAESSLNLGAYFGRCLSTGHKLTLKHFAMQNFYGANTESISNVLNHDTCKSICFLEMFGGLSGNMANVFLDNTWKDLPMDMKTDFKTTRCNEPASQHVNILSNSSGMERLYFVGTKSSKTGHTPPSAPVTPAAETPTDKESMALGQQYLYAITRYHGSSMKHLLLSDQWPLGQDEISDLVRFCPNLEQLGLAISTSNLDTFRLLMPFLSKLQCIRILPNDSIAELWRSTNPEEHINNMGVHLERGGAKHVKYIGLGDHIYRARNSYQDENGEWRREVEEIGWDEVQHIEIWKLDSLDISLEPIARFSSLSPTRDHHAYSVLSRTATNFEFTRGRSHDIETHKLLRDIPGR